ncbi:unnamed protein product [Soboliphyme baturini]|uniref:Transmembrane protein n=1 Tax=Soboliphyme baturini TaxID=241478 RepID=A0A183J4X9_9BILA|nr:unnamed protein product [Soboliphyme baturini]
MVRRGGAATIKGRGEVEDLHVLTRSPFLNSLVVQNGRRTRTDEKILTVFIALPENSLCSVLSLIIGGIGLFAVAACLAIRRANGKTGTATSCRRDTDRQTDGRTDGRLSSSSSTHVKPSDRHRSSSSSGSNRPQQSQFCDPKARRRAAKRPDAVAGGDWSLTFGSPTDDKGHTSQIVRAHCSSPVDRPQWRCLFRRDTMLAARVRLVNRFVPTVV